MFHELGRQLGKTLDANRRLVVERSKKHDEITITFTGGNGVAYMLHRHFWVYAFYSKDGTESPVYEASSKDQAIRKMVTGAELLGWTREDT